MTHQGNVRLLKAIVLIGIYGGLLMPLMFLPIVIFPFVFSKLIFFQILVGLTFPAYLILAWIEPAYRPRFHMLFAALAAYFVALGLSVAFAVDPSRAWWGNQERMNGLFTLLHLFAWLTMTIALIKTWDQWRRLLKYEVVLSLLMSLLALYQKYFDANILLFPAGDRVGGLLDNPIYLGAYEIFNLFFLALLSLRIPSRLARICFAVIAVFDVWAFFGAQSRGDLLGLAAGIVAFALYVAVFSKQKKARYGILGLAALMFLGYGLLFLFRDVPAIHNSSLARLVDFTGSISTRLIAWKIAWQGFLARPITGWGLDNFHLLFNQYYNPQSLRFGIYETWFDRSHNTILDVLSMTGILGFITFAAMFITMFVSSWQAFRKGWVDLPIAAILFSLPVAYFVQNLFVFDHPAVFSMSFLMYALVIAASRKDFIQRQDAATVATQDKKQVKRDMPWISFALIQALAVLLVWRTSVLPFQASRYAIMANSAFNQQNLPVALALSKMAAALPTPYLDEQTFLLSRNIIAAVAAGTFTKFDHWQDMYALTKQLTDQQLADHPRDTHALYIYARLAQEMIPLLPSEAKLAEQLFRRSIETSPKRQQLYYGLAKLYVDQHRLNDLVDIFRQIRDLDPGFGEGHWNYGLTLYYDKGDKSNGAKELVESQAGGYPYNFHDARELLAMADAYSYLNDMEGLKTLVAKLGVVPAQQSPAQVFAELAYRYHAKNLTDQQNQVLAFGNEHDHATQAAYDRLLQQGDRTATTTSAVK